jgi:SAM-dependent methyltransferase
MTARNNAATVVGSYEDRARFSRAETAAVRRPRLLRGLLNTAKNIAEIPCGTGHFLADYVRAGVAVTLVDASAAMLAVAIEHAAEVGLHADRTFPTLTYLQDMKLPDGIDLVIAPNAALNQLACQGPLNELLAGLRATVGSGTDVLAQVACTHPGDGVDTATFYDATREHGVWFADRRFNPTNAGGAVLRRRRQHRDGDRLQIEFDYHDPAGTSLHAATVELALFSVTTLTEAFTAAGFTHVRFLPGQGGLSEILATAEATGSRR